MRANAKGSTVQIDLPAAGTWTFHFRYDTGAEWTAILLAADINRRIGDVVSAARQEAYNDGWKHAKAKTKKRDYFSSWLNLK